MATLKVKVLDFLNLEGLDGDICDDYDDSLYIAYCSGYTLTEQGKKHFADILDFDIEIRQGKMADFSVQLSHIYDNWEEPSEDSDEFEELINVHGDVAHPLHWKFYELFEGLAGNISTEKYDKWFTPLKEEE
jgi:hypothetical protein